MASPGAQLIGRTALIIVAGGSGKRFGGFKQLAELGGQPLLRVAIRAFATLPFAERIVVLPQELIDRGVGVFEPPENIVRFIPGGAERADSVREGVRACGPEVEYVAVHDGARPFPPISAIRRAFEMLAADHALGGAILCSPMTDTVKRVGAEGRIQITLPRTDLRRAETPQIVRRDLLTHALEQPGFETATDEAQLLEWWGHTVAAVSHEGLNLKITTEQDLAIADAMLALKTRNAQLIDTHR
ncbi:MAG: 2-C-methyl-D-erythritol 4-phosphate cytidylyltransferase [Candidatus Sumerlaeia bacterium]|nr:2-C-methyl-D-erythritol 4-phosphate cytidylyltransferase [Candidatus Sumerlaeia bacterium]